MPINTDFEYLEITNLWQSFWINWASPCHVGKGARPEAVASQAQFDNIDCLKCHAAGGERPTRADCLTCHAKAGGGDAVKRGDLALATGSTTDSRYDVHMATTGAYPTSRPLGSVQEGKLYPFKYKTAEQPMTLGSQQLVALDTSVCFATADAGAAVRQGLVNMGMSGDTPWEWVLTDSYQSLNHQVGPKAQALQCSACHDGSGRMDLRGELGYGLKAAQSSVCTQCHGTKENKPFQTIHDKHVKDKRYDCSWCVMTSAVRKEACACPDAVGTVTSRAHDLQESRGRPLRPPSHCVTAIPLGIHGLTSCTSARTLGRHCG